MIKRVCHYLCFLAVLPLVVTAHRVTPGVGDFFFHLWATALALMPGKIGSYLRVAFYRGVVDHVDRQVNIGFGTFFSKRTVRLAPHVSIGAYCVIGSAIIGRNCTIASRVSIPSGKRQHGSGTDRESVVEPTFTTITIGEYTWIGEGAIILADVGDHCVVGAGSVVVKPVSRGETVAGNPAREIKGRQGNCSDR